MFVAIVPAYNEAARVGSVVNDLFAHVDKVIVVDDGSADATADVAQMAGAVVISHKTNRGQGAALETGHVYARHIGADLIVHFDADGQFSVEDIPLARKILEDTASDIVFGTRYRTNSNTTVPHTKRYLLRPLGRLVDRLFGGLPLSDAHNGFRLFNKKALDVLRITQSGMAHATEIPVLVKQHQLTYSEVPIQVTYHEYGQGVKNGFRVVHDLFLGKVIK